MSECCSVCLPNVLTSLTVPCYYGENLNSAAIQEMELFVLSEERDVRCGDKLMAGRMDGCGGALLFGLRFSYR